MTRLEPQPGERLDRATVLRFTFDGEEVSAFAGDTIASALYAAGRRTFSRSFKYHRRRGLLCCAGQCPNCLVAVDGAPGIRACTEPVREGAAVEHLNARPGLEFDVMAVTDRAGRLVTPPGFYYKTFIRPRALWPLYEKVLRHAAGLGVLPKKGYGAHRRQRTEYRRRHADVLVTGGGVAGLHAAITAARAGADVLLADEGPTPGGRALAEDGHGEAAALVAQAREAGVEILAGASVLGYFDGLVPIWQGSTLHQVRAPQHIIASGTIEQPLVFEGNDLPGVMLSGGARRLIALYAIRPGRRAVIASATSDGRELAVALGRAGIEVLETIDLRAGATIEASGRRDLARVTITTGGERHAHACDLLITEGPRAPAGSIALQAGAKAQFDPHSGVFRLIEAPENIYLAGDVAGQRDPAASGRAAGAHAAAALGLDATATGIEKNLERDEPAVAATPLPTSGHCFVCFCEDVTTKDFQLSAAEGFDSLELSKRYTTSTMGPCQGRMCQLNAARALAAQTGQDLAAVGITTARPPWVTVPLGVLAGRPFEPAKRSALHARHEALGGSIRWAGDWLRPYDYGAPEAEVAAVHDGAGVIDVGTLGKLLVRGPDAGELLDRLYPNTISTIAPGRIRYGVLTSDAGRIIDDGTVARLDGESFFVTTTSSGAGAVERWFAWWLATWELDATITDLTQGLGAMNLAGPASRVLLARVSDLDLSAEGFRYLDARQGRVAGVNCLALRIGFVGELGYEIHCPAAQAGHVWDALVAAGARPFGLEPQRLLRLQKAHVIVTQDTDTESTPFGAAMGWIVKLDKPADFVGRWALEHAQERGTQRRLVGFSCADERAPREGAVVLDRSGALAGEVTSARRSAKLGLTIGLAFVPAELAHDGAQLTILDERRRWRASVTTQPFYDPEGAVLRS
jgi:sarcosine oxidase subunit alpha